MNIPFVNLSKSHSASLNKKILFRIKTILDQGNYAQGAMVSELEELCKSFLDEQSMCLATASGTSSLHLALEALEIGKGDEVIVPAYTWIASIIPVIKAGAIPVIADVDRKTYTLSYDAVKLNITKKTKAILPVHIFGNPCDMAGIRDLAFQNNLSIIEDACQAHGTLVNTSVGVPAFAGTHGDIACFSFYPTKNLGGIGEGGLCVTKDKDLYNKMEAMRQFGKDSSDKENPGLLGFNYKMDEVRAAALVEKCELLPWWNTQRASVALNYRNVIDILPTMEFQQETHGTSSNHFFALTTKSPDKLQLFLDSKGIQTSSCYRTLPHESISLKKYCQVRYDTLNATYISRNNIVLPIQPYLTDQEVSYICESLIEYKES
tara:strand:+ start:379 stop:1509 length:1131 start_codon:yes stop_codon:yes gene_type:complete